MKRYASILFVLLILAGCAELEPASTEFPIMTTHEAVNIKSSGATFGGEVIALGSKPTTSYGFVWDIYDPNMETGNVKEVGKTLIEGKFEIVIDFALVKGLTYKVRTYATYDSKTAYGNVVEFKSEGSTNMAWTLENKEVVIPGTYPVGFSNATNGFVLSYSSPSLTLSAFDKAQKTFVYLLGPPENANYLFNPLAASANTPYVFAAEKAFKYENNGWVSVGAVAPYMVLDRFLHYGNGSLYLLNTVPSYKLNTGNGQVTNVPGAPVSISDETIRALASVNGKAYVITSAKNLLEFDPATEAWTKKSEYPGTPKHLAVTFVIGDKIYFGPGYFLSDPGKSKSWIEKRMWSYQVSTNTWTPEQSFPLDLPASDVFYFQLDGKLYVGFDDDETPEGYALYSFDPSK